MRDELQGRCLVEGRASGSVLFSDVGLSFWGGVDPATGEIIDRHHPLSGCCVAGAILAIPAGRGSCTGSSVMLETILSGTAPAALVFERVEEILTLGVIVAEEIFGRSIPVVCLAPAGFAQLRDVAWAEVDGAFVRAAGLSGGGADFAPVSLSPTAEDQAFLDGAHGLAAQAAMRIIVRMAGILGASALHDVTRGHIDGCVYTGPSSLAFARRLCDWGARVRIPTTMNSISVDHRRWRAQGVEPGFGAAAAALADAYVAMGAQASFTCAPYLMAGAPALGEQIVWAESNAVVFANSVLGARTMKYPDYLDIAIALTGRAPLSGCHLDAPRRGTVAIEVVRLAAVDDSFWPLLGYQIGAMVPDAVPVISGVAHLGPSLDDLKAFGAAFATTSAAPMFHIAGVTPEAEICAHEVGRTAQVGMADLRRAWGELNGAAGDRVDLVALGNPHFSVAECVALAGLCAGRQKCTDVAVAVTCSRATQDALCDSEVMMALAGFGVQMVTDTCWCMVTEPLIPPTARTIMTNSGKYAHYGPGLVGRGFRFGSLAACVDAACCGVADQGVPAWLRQVRYETSFGAPPNASTTRDRFSPR